MQQDLLGASDIYTAVTSLPDYQYMAEIGGHVVAAILLGLPVHNEGPDRDKHCQYVLIEQLSQCHDIHLCMCRNIDSDWTCSCISSVSKQQAGTAKQLMRMGAVGSFHVVHVETGSSREILAIWVHPMFDDQVEILCAVIYFVLQLLMADFQVDELTEGLECFSVRNLPALEPYFP